MKTCTKILVVILAIMFGLALATPTFAVVTPGMTLTDGTNTVTIDQGGNVTFSAGCVSCSTNFVSAQPGSLVWGGKLGTWTVAATAGLSKPNLSGAPHMDVSIQSAQTSGGGTLKVFWSDINFTTPDIVSVSMQAGGNVSGGSVTFQTYVDDSNVAFGQGILSGTVGPISGAPFTGSASGPGPTQTPFSMTEVVTLNLAAGGVGAGDFEVQALPSQLAVTCPTSVGTVGTPYSSALNATGGVPPYLFTLFSGSLPPGLTLDGTSGAITGTPTAAGTFSFVGQVTDTINGTATTGATACQIVTSPQLFKLSGYTYEDLNQPVNMIYDNPPDIPIPNVIVTLEDCSGNVLNTTVTDANGYYEFNSLAAGCYKVSAPTSTTSQTRSVNLETAQQLTVNLGPDSYNNNFGYVAPGTISGYTYTDHDHSMGIYNPPPDTPIGSVTVTLTYCDGTPVPGQPPVATDGTGFYQFTNLAPGCYHVTAPPTANGMPADTPSQLTVNLPYAGNSTHNDFGYVYPINIACGASTGQVGVFFSTQLVATGGGGTYTFSIDSGSLPPGLTLNTSSGVISGTPTTAGTFNFAVKVVDQYGNFATNGPDGCGITIAPPPSQLQVVKTPDNGNFTMGSQVSFTIVVSNPAASGSETAKNVTLTDTLPTNGGLTWSSATTTQGTCSITSNVLTCTIGDLAPQASATIVVTSPATTPTGACQSQPNPAAIATADGGLTAQDSGSLSCTPPPPQLKVVKTPKNGSFTMGSQASFQIVVSNPAAAGSQAATNVTLSDTLPTNGGLTWANATTSQGTCSVTANVLNCSLGSLAAGASATINVYSPATTPNGACQSQPNPAAIATADGGLTAQDSGSLTCTPPPVSATCVQITAIAGMPITPVTLTASGGTGGPYTFSATGLPSGLTMSSGGTISGTPTVTGTFNYTVTVTDKDGHVGTANCSVTVQPPPSNICGLTWGYWKNHVSKWPVTSLMLGSQTYNQTELQALLDLAVKGDASINLAHQLIAAKFNVLNGTNPATDGGAISAADNILSTFSGKLPYGVDPNSAVGSQMVAIAAQLDYFNSDGLAQPGCSTGEISSPLSLICASSTGQVGVPYSSAVIASGGIQPYTFSIIGGSLPPGLTLNSSTGAITGTPTTAGTFNFTVQVADATAVPGSTAGTKTSNCSITVTLPPPPITVTCPSGTGTLGIAYSSNVGASGGSGGYKFTITSGSLPAGLTLNSTTGQITGTPTKAGTYSFTVTVTDSNKNSGSSNCSIAIGGGISAGDYYTYTQGGWGATPHGNNPGALLTKNFSKVYPGKSVSIGGSYKLTFNSALAITNFLPQGGTPGSLTANATNPTTSAAKVFAGQVLALQLNVDFSNAGITPGGLANLKVVSGALAGQTVAQVLAIANSVLGGSAPPSGMTISNLNDVVDSINNNFDNGNTNKGYLQ